tara:strand:- start:3500 stop:3715 length:216 start_codon:yes stop_codon:yes gene_type:complete
MPFVWHPVDKRTTAVKMMLIDAWSLFIVLLTVWNIKTNNTMGKQHNKMEKRKRRKAYNKRKKESAKAPAKS